MAARGSPDRAGPRPAVPRPRSRPRPRHQRSALAGVERARRRLPCVRSRPRVSAIATLHVHMPGSRERDQGTRSSCAGIERTPGRQAELVCRDRAHARATGRARLPGSRARQGDRQSSSAGIESTPGRQAELVCRGRAHADSTVHVHGRQSCGRDRNTGASIMRFRSRDHALRCVVDMVSCPAPRRAHQAAISAIALVVPANISQFRFLNVLPLSNHFG
jgi:hypothetical protein